MWSIGFFIPTLVYSRVSMGSAGIAAFCSILGWRVLTLHGGRFASRFFRSRRRVAIVGVGERAKSLADLILEDSIAGYDFVGYATMPGEGVDLPFARIGLRSCPSRWLENGFAPVIVAVDENAYIRH